MRLVWCGVVWCGVVVVWCAGGVSLLKSSSSPSTSAGPVGFGSVVCASAHTLPVALSRRRDWIGLVSNWIGLVNASRLKMDRIYRRRTCHAVSRVRSRSRSQMVVGQGEGDFIDRSSRLLHCCAVVVPRVRCRWPNCLHPAEVAGDIDFP